MSTYFCLSVTFLIPTFHGRGDGGQPEWPPSPLRTFQALVAAAARRRQPHAFDALRWLEEQPSPVIVAPIGVLADSYCLSVPNNAMDVVARARVRGNDSLSEDANPATHRTMKNIRPTLMMDGESVYYLWQLENQPKELLCNHLDELCNAARSVVAVGWGVDMAIGHGSVLSASEVESLAGERWFPSTVRSGNPLRVPQKGTLTALVEGHEAFVNRITSDGLTVPPIMTAFAKIMYRRGWDAQPKPVAAFALLRPDGREGFRSFDTASQALTVAGMLRHATQMAAECNSWPRDCIDTSILGHAEAKGEAHVSVGSQRFAYIPLPSIEFRGEEKVRVVGSVRRGMLTTFSEGFESEMAWAQRAVSGQELLDEDSKKPTALLSSIGQHENIVRYYTQPSATWATVTPVVLPGYDDPAHLRRRLKRGTGTEEQSELLSRLNKRIEGLLRKALLQAGFSAELAENSAMEWRKVGFWPGTDFADKYGVPDHLARFPRLHVKIQWRNARRLPVDVYGPICIGGGRFYGLGLFAAF